MQPLYERNTSAGTRISRNAPHRKARPLTRVPVQHFSAALPLIGISIRNVVLRLIVQYGGLDMLATAKFVRPTDPELFAAPWRRETLPSLAHIKLGEQTYELPGWGETPVADLRSFYEKQRTEDPENPWGEGI